MPVFTAKAKILILHFLPRVQLTNTIPLTPAAFFQDIFGYNSRKKIDYRNQTGTAERYRSRL